MEIVLLIALLIVLIDVLVELIYSPRLDITEDEELILWYGRLPHRKHFKITRQW